MFSIIVAISENNVIGMDNKLIWTIPNDLTHFKSITMNSTIIMGRKTFESLPKVLPNRHHIVLTNSLNYHVNSENVEIYSNANDIIKKYINSPKEFFVIGGGEIYSLFLPFCKKLYITKIYKSFIGDTYFPSINYDEWSIITSSALMVDEMNNLTYSFIDYIKK